MAKDTEIQPEADQAPDMDVARPPQIFSLWIAGDLGSFQRMCLASFVAHGHPVALYSYGSVRNLPDGVVRYDAREIMPAALIGQVGEGPNRYSTIADVFRWWGFARGAGVWVDCDVVCLRPLPTTAGMLAGMVSGAGPRGYVGTSVLHLPPDDPLVAEALSWMEPGRVPFWLQPQQRLGLRIRRAAGLATSQALLPKGTLGPQMLTALLRQAARLGEVRPADRFAPLASIRAGSAFDGSLSLCDLATPETFALHLWTGLSDDRKIRPPEPGSIYAELRHRYG